MTTAHLTRIEYLTKDGWVTGHAGIALLHPERYVKRLAERGKWGRAVVLGDDLQPVRTYEPKDLPDLADLVPDPPYQAHKLRPPAKECPYCLGTLCGPDDLAGVCLL